MDRGPTPRPCQGTGGRRADTLCCCVPVGEALRGGAMGSCRSGSALLAFTLVLGVLTSPLGAQAPPAGKAYRIGWLSPASAENGRPNLDALRQGLRQLGYAEGRNITIELRWADSATDRLAELASELVRLKVDVICTAGSQATGAAKGATTTIPVVFSNVAFPDQTGLVASYARPGGNVTGVAFVGPEYGKRLELLREVRPGLSRVALIYNPENKGSVLALRETERWAKSLGIDLEPHVFRGPQDFQPLFAAIAKKPPHALMTTADPLIASNRAPIVEFAGKHRLVSIYPGASSSRSGASCSTVAASPRCIAWPRFTSTGSSGASPLGTFPSSSRSSSTWSSTLAQRGRSASRSPKR